MFFFDLRSATLYSLYVCTFIVLICSLGTYSYFLYIGSAWPYPPLQKENKTNSQSSSQPLYFQVKKSSTGSVSIVEYIDPDCTHCMQLHSFANSENIYKNINATIYLHFVPLASHPDSFKKTTALICGFRQQQNTLTMLDYLYVVTKFTVLEYDDFISNIQRTLTDTSQYTSCVQSDEVKKFLQRSIAESSFDAIRGVPSFRIFENEKLINTFSSVSASRALDILKQVQLQTSI
jgi:Thioredoxin